MSAEQMTLKEVQACQLEMLWYIYAFCQQQNIQYYLGYGSCLGAVRHQGFIPWDDDIDLVMFRADYARFEAAFNRQSGPYRLLSVVTDDRYTLPLPKVIDTRTELNQTQQRDGLKLGVYIDLFVMDDVPAGFATCALFASVGIKPCGASARCGRKPLEKAP